MTSKPSRTLLILSTLVPASACYSPDNPAIATGDPSSAEDGSSDATSSPTTDDLPTTADTTSASDASATLTTAHSDPSDGESTTAVSPACGDGMVEADEVCDDGVNDGSYGGCLPDCTGLGPHCGDAIEQADEACDDGDQTNGNGCNNDCVESGVELWTRTFDGAAHESDYINGVAVGPGDWIVAAGQEGLPSYNERAWVRRYTSDGDDEWTAAYDGATGDDAEASGVSIDPDGGIYVSGGYDGLTEGGNGFARKYDDRGVVEYTHIFNGTSDGGDGINGVVVDDDGYAVIAGSESRADIGQGSNILVRRLGQDGTELWTRTLATNSSDIAQAIATGSDGTIVVVGSSAGDIWIRKYNQDGGTLWTETFHASNFGSDAKGVAIDGSGKIVVVGWQGTMTGASGWVRQYDENGNELWAEVIESSYFNAAAVDADTNVIVAGLAQDAEGSVAIVRKYANDGSELWTHQWHVGAPVTTAATSARALAVDSSGSIIVGGYEALDDEPADGWIRKIAP